MVPFVENASNLMGATIEKEGIVATFPLATLKEGFAFYVVDQAAAQARPNYASKMAVRFTYSTNGQSIYGIIFKTGNEGELLPIRHPMNSGRHSPRERMA